MTFEKVCKELNLDDTPDWGIINSDGSRVIEFIEYVGDGAHIDFRIRYSFVELIVASMNDVMKDGVADCEVHARFYEYIKQILNDDRYYPFIPYWISIKSYDEFPVGYLLERYKEEDQKEIT